MSRGDRSWSRSNPSEYQKEQESFGTQGSYGAQWDKDSSQKYSNQSRQSSDQGQNYGQDVKGQLRHNRASDSNQNQRGVNEFDSNIDEQKASRRQAKDHDQDTIVDKMKDKVGDVVEKVEDLASSAWEKISGSSSKDSEKDRK